MISIERRTSDYGTLLRQIQVSKSRGRAFREGIHDTRIVKGGLRVFPRLVASEHCQQFDGGDVPSGIPALGQLTGGGLTRGTSTLIVGPAGTGKSTLAAQFAVAAAQRGERTAIFLFEELRRTYLHCTEGIRAEFNAKRAVANYSSA